MHSDAVGANRLGDILDLLSAGKVDWQAELALHVIVGGARDENAARRAKLLKARRHVHAVAEEIIAFDHHVAEIDADTEYYAALGRSLALMRGDTGLNGHGASNGIDDGVELNQGAIAHELDDASLMLVK